MVKLNNSDVPLFDPANEDEIPLELQDCDIQGRKLKPTSNVMRKIEIMQENKLLKSSIDDIYEL
jgi:hypothetical protein